jgi:serine/threonine protein kinase
VHRDLKLENLLLAKPGDISVVKIADFGLAKQVGGDLAERRSTTALLPAAAPPLAHHAHAAGGPRLSPGETPRAPGRPAAPLSTPPFRSPAPHPPTPPCSPLQVVESMSTVCGTPQYVAPEVIQGTPGLVYGPGVDMWSAGEGRTHARALAAHAHTCLPTRCPCSAQGRASPRRCRAAACAT